MKTKRAGHWGVLLRDRPEAESATLKARAALIRRQVQFGAIRCYTKRSGYPIVGDYFLGVGWGASRSLPCFSERTRHSEVASLFYEQSFRRQPGMQGHSRASPVDPL